MAGKDKTPSKIYILKQYLLKYGNVDLNTLLEKLQNGKKYKCPNCEGVGTIEEMRIVDSNDGSMGYWYDVKCYVCNGYGYTLTEKKPKMKQVGWE